MNQDMQLGRKLVDLFYPLVELTIFNAEGSIQEILNAFSTLKEDQTCDLKDCQIGTPFPGVTRSRTKRPLFNLSYL